VVIGIYSTKYYTAQSPGLGTVTIYYRFNFYKYWYDFVFTNNKGTPICHNNFRSRIFALDIIESKVRKIRFHDLRHTALTIMVDSGINIKTVQFIAGHKDITTTMKYVYLLGDSLTDVTKNFQINP
jgi:site-specific recombinase XerD